MEGLDWDILRGNYTTRKTERSFYDNGYTGDSDGWRKERIYLLDYRGKSILLRFELFADFVTTYRGMAIDNLRIADIDLEDSFESPDINWFEEGWIRTDNRLPQRTWVQVVQEGPDGLLLERFMQTASAEMTNRPAAGRRPRRRCRFTCRSLDQPRQRLFAPIQSYGRGGGLDPCVPRLYLDDHAWIELSGSAQGQQDGNCPRRYGSHCIGPAGGLVSRGIRRQARLDQRRVREDGWRLQLMPWPPEWMA